MEIYDLDPYFWKIISCLKIYKEYFCYVKEFEFFHKSCTTAVAMATMTFQTVISENIFAWYIELLCQF